MLDDLKNKEVSLNITARIVDVVSHKDEGYDEVIFRVGIEDDEPSFEFDRHPKAHIHVSHEALAAGTVTRDGLMETISVQLAGDLLLCPSERDEAEK